MAQTVYCNGHPDVAAVYLIQELGTPEVMTLCAACVIAWAGAIVAATEQPPPEPASEPEFEMPGPGDFIGAEGTGLITAPAVSDALGYVAAADDGIEESTGGDEHDGALRARSGGVDGTDRPTPGEAGLADEGAGSGTDRPGRQRRKPAEARTGD